MYGFLFLFLSVSPYLFPLFQLFYCRLMLLYMWTHLFVCYWLMNQFISKLQYYPCYFFLRQEVEEVFIFCCLIYLFIFIAFCTCVNNGYCTLELNPNVCYYFNNSVQNRDKTGWITTSAPSTHL